MIEENGAADMTVMHMRSHSGRAGRRTATAAAPIDRALIEKWALFYLERYASSAENLRRVLGRRVRRRLGNDDEKVRAAGVLIDALVANYRATGLLDDAAYAAGRAKSGLARGRSLRRIAAGLAAKGIGAEDAAAAMAALANGVADPELAAACAFAHRRHLGPFRRAKADHRRELAAFALAGFGRRTADAVLACTDEAALAALLGSSE
jgi:regulatory protein